MVEPSEGVKLRAQIDTEVVRGLLVANGGGAVALLAFLPKTFETEQLNPLALYIVSALLAFLMGIVATIVHNHYRRRCSLANEAHNFRPPPGKLFGLKLRQPTVCWVSYCFMWASIASFIGGGLVVFVGAFGLAYAIPRGQVAVPWLPNRFRFAGQSCRR
jgi:hypothetical protein